MRPSKFRIGMLWLTILTLGGPLAAPTETAAAFIAKLAKKKYQAQLKEVVKLTDETMLAEIAKSSALPVGVTVAAAERLTAPERIADVARAAQSYEVLSKLIEKTSDQAVLKDILMEPKSSSPRSLAARAAAAKLTEASAAEVAAGAPDEFNRVWAISRLSDPKLLVDIAIREKGNLASTSAIERLTDQDALALFATRGETASMRMAAIKKVTDQGLLGRIAAGAGPLGERRLALSQLTDQDALAALALSESAEVVLRADATRKIEDANILARIARSESHLDVLWAALVRLNDEAALIEVARTARYRLTRRLIVARLDSHWCRDVGLGSANLQIGAFQTEVRATIRNTSQDFAYGNLRYTFSFLGQIQAERAPSFSGQIEPGKTEAVSDWLSGDWRSTLKEQTVLILLAAEPALPNEAKDLAALGEAPLSAGANRAPVIADQAVWKHSTTSNIFGIIESVTSEVMIQATDPDEDVLTYEWMASNGTVEARRPIAVWRRPVDNGKVVGGTITVTADDRRGGRVTKTFKVDLN